MRYVRSPTWRHALARVDYLGNAIFMPAMIALFLGLLMGGVQYPWGSWHVIVPLVLGVCGWVLFHVHQASRLCKEPSMPPQLFQHRTSAGGFVLIFFGAVVLQAVSYFLPVYFQAVLGMSPLLSGVSFLPFALGIMPFGGLAGAIMSKTGRYIPLYFVGFALCAVGFGLLSMLSDGSSTAAWVCFQIVAAGAVGIVFTVSLPSTLAALPESFVATATGTYSFVRSFGLVWGVTIASVIFNGRINDNAGIINDPSTRSALMNGAAYADASGGFISSLDIQTRGEVIQVYVAALRTVWLTMVGMAGIGFFCVFIMKHVDLRKETDTEFGLADKSDSTEQLRGHERQEQTETASSVESGEQEKTQ